MTLKRLTQSQAALLLLTIQLVLVLSVAGKYLYERKTRPRIWVRATQYDPSQPLRGRYIALKLLFDACSLPRDQDHYNGSPVQLSSKADGVPFGGSWTWNVSLMVENGHLVPRVEDRPKSPVDKEELSLWAGRPCEQAELRSELELFIPDTAKMPFPLKPGQQLWVEVTIPPSGPPRPIQLAISTAAGFQPLHFE